jgi:hypothetical protein
VAADGINYAPPSEKNGRIMRIVENILYICPNFKTTKKEYTHEETFLSVDPLVDYRLFGRDVGVLWQRQQG